MCVYAYAVLRVEKIIIRIRVDGKISIVLPQQFYRINLIQIITEMNLVDIPIVRTIC